MTDNFAFRRPQGRQVTTDPKKVNKIKDMLDKGHSYGEISDELKMPRGSVARHVKNNGWQTGRSNNPAGRRGNPEAKSERPTPTNEPYKPKLKDDFQETEEDRKYRKKLGFDD